MSVNTLLDKVWHRHVVGDLPGGEQQIFIDLQLIHEVTSSPAFRALIRRKIDVMMPNRQLAVIDHVAPTDWERVSGTDEDKALAAALLEHCEIFGIDCFDIQSTDQGIVHIRGPELGTSQPGMTIVCGDSHTSTHGAFGAIAWGIGTSQVAQVLATQCLPMTKPKVRHIIIDGKLGHGVTAKDVALYIIHKLGVKGGKGWAYEYGGSAVSAMSMEARMTLCNMTIEAGARFGYINPDKTTIDYLRGLRYAPKNGFDVNEKEWLECASGQDAEYDDEISFDATDIAPTITWGTNPGEAVPIDACIPDDANKGSLEYMKFKAGQLMIGMPIHVGFIGSCTNGRLSDLREAAAIVKGKKVANGVRAVVVPGSEEVRINAEEEGLDEIFKNAGFEWRRAGCSFCLAMNADKLVGDQICVSSSNRNFRGRQGSPTGRTILASPIVVAASVIEGVIADPRNYIGGVS